MTKRTKEEALRAFDEQFGYAIFDEEKDEWGRDMGRWAGCDGCDSNKDIRKEHRDFISKTWDEAYEQGRRDNSLDDLNKGGTI